MVAFLAVVKIVSSAQSQSLMTRHVREATLNGAPLVGRLSQTKVLRLVVALPLRNQEELDRLLQDLYDPSSPSYRKFLTVEEFTDRFGPSQVDYDALIRFARESGLKVTGISRNRVNLNLSGTVANIERAFHVTLGLLSASHRTSDVLCSRPRTIA